MDGMFLPLALGIVLVILGIINIRGNISSIHWYNRRKVTQADVPKYGRCMGIGTLVIGVSIVLYALVRALVVLVPIACVIGIGLMLYAQFKYNKGIF